MFLQILYETKYCDGEKICVYNKVNVDKTCYQIIIIIIIIIIIKLSPTTCQTL